MFHGLVELLERNGLRSTEARALAILRDDRPRTIGVDDRSGMGP